MWLLIAKTLISSSRFYKIIVRSEIRSRVLPMTPNVSYRGEVTIDCPAQSNPYNIRGYSQYFEVQYCGYFRCRSFSGFFTVRAHVFQVTQGSVLQVLLATFRNDLYCANSQYSFCTTGTADTACTPSISGSDTSCYLFFIRGSTAHIPPVLAIFGSWILLIHALSTRSI